MQADCVALPFWSLKGQSLKRMSAVARQGLVAFGLLMMSTTVFAKSQVPDISGIWLRDPSPNDGDIDYPPPPGGPPPFKEPYASTYEAAIKRRDEAHAQGKTLAEDASALCKPEGMPTMMGGTYDLEILQSKHDVVVLAEFLTQTRRIFLGEPMPALEEIAPGYAGYSVGHWEGDVLVVTTQGIREDVQFMNMPHSKQMRITERIRRVPGDRLEDHITIEDLVVFTRPYSFTFGYKRDEGYHILENICDDNRWVPNDKGELILKTDH